MLLGYWFFFFGGGGNHDSLQSLMGFFEFLDGGGGSSRGVDFNIRNCGDVMRKECSIDSEVGHTASVNCGLV